DLRINGENAGGEELPAFLDERLIMGIIANKEDDLKFKKHQIELFFSVHTDPKERAEYLKSAYHDRYTEVILDGGVRCGYKPQEDGLLMWEGAYLSRTKESVFSWDCIVGFTDQLIKKKEYSPGIINRRTKKLPPQDSNQLTLFDVFDMGVAEPSEETPQLSLFPKWEASQQIIDETLCIGANERKSLLDICARFMKDKSVEENAEWLKEHYGTSGTGFFFEGRRIAVWYDENGIRIGEGDTAQRSTATVVTWEQAAKRIRELLDLGRYMPQKLIDQAADHENMHIAEYLIFAVRDFSEEADNAGYVPIIQQVIAEYHIFPDMPNKLIEYFKDPPMLQKLVDEWAEFTEAHKANPRLMRFKHHNPAKILGWLQDLQREPVIFRAAEGFDPKRERFITKDEIDRLLRGSEQRSDYRLGVYSFFRTHKDTKEREKYLREKFGTGGGTYDGNAYTNHDGKGYSFSRGDIMSPFAKITLSWAQVTKRITELYNRNSFLTEQDKEGMAEYEL
ncbi:MAG: DNA methylase, partial [Clostridia bacterium]|nr:DNA methylase [Clostridia bacterium]